MGTLAIIGIVALAMFGFGLFVGLIGTMAELDMGEEGIYWLPYILSEATIIGKILIGVLMVLPWLGFVAGFYIIIGIGFILFG